MLNDINKPFEMNKEDMELHDMFHGEKKALHPDTVYETLVKPTAGTEKKVSTNATNAEKAAQKPAKKPMNESCVDAEYQPVKSAPNWFDNLKACAKWAVLFGGLNVLIFYWQQAGLMDASVAVPSMCVCAALAGWGVGKNAAGGNK